MHLRDRLDDLRRKPEPVRRSIALGVSAGITALVAVGYLGALVSSDRLSLSAPSPEDAEHAAALAATNDAFFSGLMGAAGAFREVAEQGANITTVETSAETTFPEDASGEEATVIPF